MIFWPRRFGLIPHIVGGLLAALTGLVPLWLGFTGRIAALHRALGRAYAAGVTIASAGGLCLAVTIDAADLPHAAGLFCLALAWTLTTGMAILAVHHRALQQHREWMTRSYSVTFAFVTFRLASKFLIARQVAPPGQIYTIMALACWALPLLAAEPIIQWRRLRAHGAGPTRLRP